jgi:hypothetical protein
MWFWLMILACLSTINILYRKELILIEFIWIRIRFGFDEPDRALLVSQDRRHILVTPWLEAPKLALGTSNCLTKQTCILLQLDFFWP